MSRAWSEANGAQRLIAIVAVLFDVGLGLLLLAAFGTSDGNGSAALGYLGLYMLLTGLIVLPAVVLWHEHRTKGY